MDHSSCLEETNSTMLFYIDYSKIFENKKREYPSLAPTKTDNKQSLWYKERESPVLHVEQVSKNLGEHGRLQILVETFTRQAARWWDTHQSRLQTWTTTLNLFVERFRGRNLTKQAQIPVFTQGQDLKNHIRIC